MNLGTAVIEFMPTIPATAVRSMTADASKAGEQAGKAIGDKLTRAATKAGLDAGEAAGRSISQKLKQLNVPPIDLKADPAKVLHDINRVENELRQLALNAPTANVRINTNAALSELRDLRIKLATVPDKTVKVDVKTDDAKKALDGLTASARYVASAIIAIGPIAVPALAAVTGTVLGLGAAAGAGLAAFGLFGAAVGSVFSEVKKQQDKIDTLKTKLVALDQEIAKYKQLGIDTTKLEEEKARVLAKINDEYSTMTPGVRQVHDAYEGLKGTWQSFIEANGPAVYGTMTKGMNSLSESVGKLQPLFDIGAVAAGKLADKFASFVSGGGLDRFVAYLSREAVPALNNMGSIANNLGVFLINIFKNFNPTGQSFLAWLNEATAKLASWSAGNGMQRFLEYVTSSGPGVGQALADIAEASVKIMQAVAPLAPITLAIATGLTRLISAVPVPVLTTIIGLFVAYNTALVAFNLYTGIAIALTKSRTAATIAWAAITRGIVILQNAWAVAQWALNAAMAANPIGLVVVAIAALVAAIVLAWKNSETFRTIVLAVWGAVKTAIGAVADWFVRNVWPAIKAALDWLGKAFQWLYANVIVPVWNGIKTAISVAWSVIQVLFRAGEAYIRTLAAVFEWLWRNIINPVWQGIKLAIQVAWVAIQIIFRTGEIAIRALALVFQWLWTNVIVPVWNGIRAAISAAWNWLVGNVFNPAINFIRGVLSAAWTFYSNLVNTVWNAIKNAVSAAWAWVRDKVLNPLRTYVTGALVNAWNTAKSGITSAWNAIKSPVQATWDFIRTKIFEPLKTFITSTIPNAFSTGVKAVGAAWTKIKELAAAPVRFVVNTVINGGIIKGFNWIASKVGAGTISPISIGFADGGILPGYTPGRDVHRFVGPAGTLDLSGGEAILRPELTRALGDEFIHAGNSAARSGNARGFLRKFMQYGDHAQFKDGGVFGGIKKIAGGVVGGIQKAWDAFTNPVDTFKSAVKGLMGGMPGGPYVRDLLSATVSKMVDAVSAKITSMFNSSIAAMGGAGGPGNWQAMWNWVKSRFPQAQLYSGLRNSTTLSGNKSLHAAGRAIDISPIRAISNAIINTFGKNITELISPWKSDHVWRGKRPHDYGHALDAQHGVYGSNAHIHWAMKMGGVLKRFGLFDSGGWLHSGGIAVNMSRKPEAVLTADESAGLKAMGVGELTTLLQELIEAVREIAPEVGSHIRGSGRRLVTQARGV